MRLPVLCRPLGGAVRTGPLLGDPIQDGDGDGAGNLSEYLQGRDPRAQAVPDTGGAVNIRIHTRLE